MPQSEVFTSLRAGLETTRGTAVNPTRILEQTDFDYTPELNIIRPSERRASYFAYYSSAIGRERNGYTFGGILSYNQAAWLGNVFFKKVTAGTETGVGTGVFRYTFAPASATDDLASATSEFGYDTALSATQPGTRLPFTVGQELGMTFDKANAEGVTFSADMHSPKAATEITAFGGTPASLATKLLTPTTVQVYIDAATIGTTEDDYVTTADFTLTHDWTDLDTLNQTTAAQDTFRVGAREWSCTLTRYGINNTEKAAWKAGTARKIRIRSTGPTLGTGTYALTLDLYGVYTGYDEPSVDGLVMQQFTLSPQYDTTAATDHALVVDTAESTVT